MLVCSGAHGATQKQYNWTTLNQRVFKKLDFVLAKSEIEAVVNCDPGAVERVLKLVKVKLEKYNDRQSQRSRYPAVIPHAMQHQTWLAGHILCPHLTAYKEQDSQKPHFVSHQLQCHTAYDVNSPAR